MRNAAPHVSSSASEESPAYQPWLDESKAFGSSSSFRARFAPGSRFVAAAHVGKSAAWRGVSTNRPDGAVFAPQSRIGDSRSVIKSAAWRCVSTNRLRGTKVAPGSRFLGRNVDDPAAWHGICATQPDRCHGAPRSRIGDTKHVGESAVWRKSGAKRQHHFFSAPRSRISDTKHVGESAPWSKSDAIRPALRCVVPRSRFSGTSYVAKSAVWHNPDALELIEMNRRTGFRLVFAWVKAQPDAPPTHWGRGRSPMPPRRVAARTPRSGAVPTRTPPPS